MADPLTDSTIMGSVFGTGGILYYILHKELDRAKYNLCEKLNKINERLSTIEEKLNV